MGITMLTSGLKSLGAAMVSGDWEDWLTSFTSIGFAVMQILPGISSLMEMIKGLNIARKASAAAAAASAGAESAEAGAKVANAGATALEEEAQEELNKEKTESAIATGANTAAVIGETSAEAASLPIKMAADAAEKKQQATK